MHRPRRAPDIVTSEVLDELVAYAPASSQAVSLNASARAIWELCDGTRTVDEICAELSEEAGVTAEALRGDVTDALARFRELGLVVGDGP
jgi:PqqD family protein of HPr-rel-A system